MDGGTVVVFKIKTALLRVVKLNRFILKYIIYHLYLYRYIKLDTKIHTVLSLGNMRILYIILP